MLVVLLILAVAGTAWSLWAEAQLRTPKRVTQPPTPVEAQVVWDEAVDGVESKRKMLDRIFAEGNPDSDEDPPTVVADRR
jgi:hypothetical protein